MPEIWSFEISKPKIWIFEITEPRIWSFEISKPRVSSFETSRSRITESFEFGNLGLEGDSPINKSSGAPFQCFLSEDVLRIRADSHINKSSGELLKSSFRRMCAWTRDFREFRALILRKRKFRVLKFRN